MSKITLCCDSMHHVTSMGSNVIAFGESEFLYLPQRHFAENLDKIKDVYCAPKEASKIPICTHPRKYWNSYPVNGLWCPDCRSEIPT